MSVAKGIHLYCDFKLSLNCEEVAGVDMAYSYNVKQQRQAAKLWGWKFIKGKDCCVACYQELKNKKP